MICDPRGDFGRAGLHLQFGSLEKYRKAIAKDPTVNQKFLKSQRHYIKKRSEEPGKSRIRDKHELRSAQTVDVTSRQGRQWMRDMVFIEREVLGTTASAKLSFVVSLGV